MFMYISLILKELFPFMKLILKFDGTTFEEVISLYENRPTLKEGLHDIFLKRPTFNCTFRCLCIHPLLLAIYLFYPIRNIYIYRFFLAKSFQEVFISLL